MSLTAFPEPKDLQLEWKDMVLDGKNISLQKYDVSNPHPGFGKDPNILNEFGHTKYPMFVGNVIVNNEEEERAAKGEPSVPQTEGWGAKPSLREDGPTIQQYIAAGYKAKTYPPVGFTSKSTQEELAQAIADKLAAEANAANSGWGQ